MDIGEFVRCLQFCRFCDESNGICNWRLKTCADKRRLTAEKGQVVECREGKDHWSDITIDMLVFCFTYFFISLLFFLICLFILNMSCCTLEFNRQILFHCSDKWVVYKYEKSLILKQVFQTLFNYKCEIFVSKYAKY